MLNPFVSSVTASSQHPRLRFYFPICTLHTVREYIKSSYSWSTGSNSKRVNIYYNPLNRTSRVCLYYWNIQSSVFYDFPTDWDRREIHHLYVAKDGWMDGTYVRDRLVFNLVVKSEYFICIDSGFLAWLIIIRYRTWKHSRMSGFNHKFKFKPLKGYFVLH